MNSTGTEDSAEITRARQRMLLYALIAAFLTGFVACPPRYWGLVRGIYPVGIWKPAIAISLEYVFLVLVAAVSAAVAGSEPKSRFGRSETYPNLLRAISVAIWAAPLSVLLVQGSALTGVVAAGIVIAGLTVANIRTQDQPKGGSHFQTADTRLFVKLLSLAIVASGLLQAAVLANWIVERTLALILFVGGSALLAARLPLAEPTLADARSRLTRRAGINVFLATTLVAFGLLPQMMPIGGGERSIDALFRLWSSGFAREVAHNKAVRIEQTPISSDGYIGVILTPRREKQKQLEVPPELRLAHRISGLPHPLTIRFTGSYLFFQFPFIRPPFDSIRAEGDPAKVGVRASNYKPLLMEAIQTLDDPIDATELGTIQLALLSEDPYPDSIAVQLVLTDIRNHLEQSLGVQGLKVRPSINDTDSSDLETLTFVVPAEPRCKQFNQIRLIFWLRPTRNQRAAAVAIQDFVLIPKGA